METKSNQNSPDKEPLYKAGEKEEHFFSETVRFALLALIIVIPIRLFIAQPFIVSGSSMDPTFENGEYLIVDELTYRFKDPERGDVIIFKFPRDPSKFFIKRVIGLPGETVVVQNGTVTITNNENPNGVYLTEPYVVNTSKESITATLDEEEYFVLGDNRPSSSDSRVWGPLGEEFVVGRALLRLLPVTRLDVLPGTQTYQEEL